jgi:hypothetical protein
LVNEAATNVANSLLIEDRTVIQGSSQGRERLAALHFTDLAGLG